MILPLYIKQKAHNTSNEQLVVNPMTFREQSKEIVEREVLGTT